MQRSFLGRQIPTLLFGVWCVCVGSIGGFVGCGERQTVFNHPPGPSSNGNNNNPQPSPNNAPGQCRMDSECDPGLRCCQERCVQEELCDLTACEEHGVPCPLADNVGLEAQGAFFCARVLAGQPPTCLQTCETSFSVSGCPTGSFCLDVNGGDQSLQVCLPSECSSSDDCPGGSCVPFGNEASYCFPAGTAQEGATCGGGTDCAPDLFCVSEPDVGNVCRPLCDMWSGEDNCEREQTCGFLTLGTGVCRPRTTTGRDIAESCDPEGDWCESGVQCFDFETGGESFPVCTAWCRPGFEDCRGRFQTQQGFCRSVFSDQSGEPVEDVGLCF